MVGGANRCPLGATPLRAPRATGPLVPSWPSSPGRATSRWKRPMKCQRHERIMSPVVLRFQMKQDARNQGISTFCGIVAFWVSLRRRCGHDVGKRGLRSISWSLVLRICDVMRAKRSAPSMIRAGDMTFTPEQGLHRWQVESPVRESDRPPQNHT